MPQVLAGAMLHAWEDHGTGTEEYCNLKRQWFPITQGRAAFEQAGNLSYFSFFSWHSIGNSGNEET